MWTGYIAYILLGAVHTVYSNEATCSIIRKTNAQIERQLHGAGFHRNLQTSVYVSTAMDLHSCYLLVKEILPSGAYSDPNELKFLREFGGPSFFIPQFVNVETSQQFSPRIQAYFFTKANFQGTSNWHANISVPVHIRYHRAKQGSRESLEERIVFPHPSVFLLCENELEEACLTLSQLEPCPPTGVQQCDWLPVNTFSTSDWVEGTVPVGNVDIIDTVLLTTATVTFGATLLLLVSLFRNTKDPYLYNKSIT